MDRLQVRNPAQLPSRKRSRCRSRIGEETQTQTLARMNKEQQRIAIAKACGWTEISPRMTWGLPPNVEDDGTENCLKQIPDYLNDLNAMREAEQTLWEKDWTSRHDFVDKLARIMSPTHGYHQQSGLDLLDATAAQRAEAFLRTLNLWQEGEP